MALRTLGGKVALITGAGSGIGEATARRLSAEGARIVVVDRDEDRARHVADSLDGLAVTGNVTDWSDQQRMVEHALAEYGRLDIAFANAGFGADRGFKAETPEHWRAMVLTNVYGVALTIRACYDAIVESKGHIVLTGSVTGRRPLVGSLYSCTKFAVTAMADAIRQELQETRVRVTLIQPGITDTRFFTTQQLDQPLQADDLARAVVYAVSQPPHVDVNEIVIRTTGHEL